MVSLTDPERRRRLQAEEVGGGDKEVVREYFNNTGFERWRKIYEETDEVNRVQLGRSTERLMVAEAEMKAKAQLPSGNLPRFEVNDLESLSGKYDTIVCLDVLIHYPQNKADGMIAHLASLAEKRVILSFAPKTFWNDVEYSVQDDPQLNKKRRCSCRESGVAGLPSGSRVHG